MPEEEAAELAVAVEVADADALQAREVRPEVVERGLERDAAAVRFREEERELACDGWIWIPQAARPSA